MSEHWIQKHVLNNEDTKGSLFANQEEAETLIADTVKQIVIIARIIFVDLRQLI